MVWKVVRVSWLRRHLKGCWVLLLVTGEQIRKFGYALPAGMTPFICACWLVVDEYVARVCMVLIYRALERALRVG